jgi:EAL domain-containing protein (putative c-di-GMP-specific phosphodiesterase class I)/ActR/RegA family two-component response regulator
MRALVFDDDEGVGRLVGRIARSVGFDTVAISSRADFAAQFAAAVPDVIVLDLQLGDTDGVEQLRFLQSQNYGNAVVLMSGVDARILASIENLARLLGLAVAGVMQKPIRAEALRALFERIKTSVEPLTAERVVQAARDGEFALEYQPIVTGRSGPLSRVEALVRWNHPMLGRLMPGRFVPIAEQSATAIEALTQWVIPAAIGDYAALRRRGHIVPMAVNLSANNLTGSDLPDLVDGRLRDQAMPPEHFCIELTETAAATNDARSMEILSRVRLKGMCLAIDDFGTGYASLRQLRQLPFSVLKIDQSFVADLATSRDAAVIVKSMVAIATTMEMESVAEGVEDEDTAALLKDAGVGALQGYLIAKPMPADRLDNWLTRWAA